MQSRNHGLPILLSKLNFHERDAHIQFDEGPHIYTIDGDESFTSVTTWNHTHFEQFDADAIIKRMMSSKKWPESKYFGMTAEEIKRSWDRNRDEAASAGTIMHYDIECYYNNCLDPNFVWTDSTEGVYFLQFLKDWAHLKPYRTEWTVFHEDLKLAGSIDMTFENIDGSLEIYDWKRSRGISKIPNGGKFSTTPCIEHLPDSNFWHYSLQLNIYRHILETKYNKQVTGMYLICLHPDNKNKSYQRIPVADLREDIQELVKYREHQLQVT